MAVESNKAIVLSPFFSTLYSESLLKVIICINIMAKFGLTNHMGRETKNSKIEALFFPSCEKISKWKSTLNGILIMNKTSYNRELCLFNSASSLLEKYRNSQETQRFKVDNDDGFISFASTFKYLGSLIDFLLDNSTNVKHRISSASKALGALSFI